VGQARADGDNEIIEVRQVQEMADFPPDVQKAAEASRRCRRRPASEHA
jgi:hypothetical protein